MDGRELLIFLLLGLYSVAQAQSPLELLTGKNNHNGGKTGDKKSNIIKRKMKS